MPRNRSDIDRDTKIDEIVAVAEQILRSDGYAGLSLSDVARRLGLARTAVLWYFPSKDDLLVAVVAKAYTAMTTTRATGDHRRRIAAAVDKLANLQPLTAALHERAQHSDKAARLATQIQDSLCERLRAVLTGHVEPDRIDITADTIVAFVQGLLAQPHTDQHRRRLLDHLLVRLTA